MPDDKPNWAVELIKNNPVVLLVIGVLVMLVAAFGSFDVNGYSGSLTPLPRILVGGLGFGLIIFSGVLTWMGIRERSSSVDIKAQFEQYRFRIVSPGNNAEVTENEVFTGIYEKKGQASFALIEESPVTNNYWFKGSLFFPSDQPGTWSCSCRVGGKAGDHRIFHLAVMGEAGAALSDYYYLASRATSHWEGIRKLTPDVFLAHSIRLRRK